MLNWRLIMRPAVTAFAPSWPDGIAKSCLLTIALQASNLCLNRVPFISTRIPARAIVSNSGFPEELRVSPRTLEAYGHGRRLLGQEYVADGKFEPAVERLFSQQEVDYIQVHSTTTGCFTFRIEQAERPLAPVPEN